MRLTFTSGGLMKYSIYPISTCRNAMQSFHSPFVSICESRTLYGVLVHSVHISYGIVLSNHLTSYHLTVIINHSGS